MPETALRNILITGASSGIGAALAREYAAQGVFLALAGRDRDRLAEIGEACRNRGAEVELAVLDVTEAGRLQRWIDSIDADQPLDLVIANAGISAGSGQSGMAETADQARRIFDVNLAGVLNTVFPVLPRMIGRGRGQVAVMSSLAAFRGIASAPAYCASKAAIRVWGEGLRGALRPHGVRVSVICPGFVESRMTAANSFPMPFLMPAERAARLIRRRLARNRSRITFPWPMAALVWLMASLPAGLTDVLIHRGARKPPATDIQSVD